ncbi:MAG: type II toxin-antitoxin system Phd/YefM family antitoxin [Myxococcales bacterium]|nr:type II toxin-antitoxin system Phd/YefM family antitoxin [Myxococcales bacterium]MCB9646341.1 type II toxin-antitoxin system Phd/YefM family antitoxin [Deltaproteobacteria bacterium]
MTKRYSIAEARRNLPTLVSEAQAGAELELTRRGEPVAVLMSIEAFRRLRAASPTFSEAYAAFLEHHDPTVDGLTEADLIGLRDGAAGRPVDL